MALFSLFSRYFAFFQTKNKAYYITIRSTNLLFFSNVFPNKLMLFQQLSYFRLCSLFDVLLLDYAKAESFRWDSYITEKVQISASEFKENRISYLYLPLIFCFATCSCPCRIHHYYLSVLAYCLNSTFSFSHIEANLSLISSSMAYF